MADFNYSHYGWRRKKKIMKKQYTVPKSLKAITAAQFIRFIELPEMDEKQTAYHALEIFCGIPPEVTFKMTRNEVDRILVHLLGMVTKKPELVQTFKLGNVEFGFIPNLTKMTFGEFLDLEGYVPEVEKHKQDHLNAWHFLNVCYRPIKKKDNGLYQIEKYTADKTHLELLKKEVNAEIYLGAIGFFLTLRKDLLQIFPTYLQNLTRRTKWTKESTRQELPLMSPTGGKEQSTTLRDTELIKLTQSLVRNYTLHSHYYNFRNKIGKLQRWSGYNRKQ